MKLGSRLAWLAVGIVIPAASALLGIPLITRMSSPAEFGRYSLYLAVVAFVGSCVAQWVQQPIGVFVPKATEGERKYLAGNVVLMVMLSITLICGIALIIWVVEAKFPFARDIIPIIVDVRFVILCAFGICAMCVVNVSQVWLQSISLPRQYALVQCVASIGKVFGPILFFYLVGMGYVAHSKEYLVYGALCGVGFAAIFAAGIFRRTLSSGLYKTLDFGFFESFETRRKAISRMTFVGLPMIPWFLAFGVVTQFDRVLISVTLGDVELGKYGAVFGLFSSATLMLLSPLQAIFWPAVVRLTAANGWISAKDFHATASNVAFIIVVCLVVMSSALSDYMLIFLGEKFRMESHGVVPLAVAAGALQILINVLHKPAEMTGGQSYMLFSMVFVASISFVGNFFALSWLGAVAASIFQVFALVVYGFLMCVRYSVRPRIGFNWTICILFISGSVAILKYGQSGLEIGNTLFFLLLLCFSLLVVSILEVLKIFRDTGFLDELRKASE